MFLQYIFGLLVCLAVNSLETSRSNKCCSRYFVHAVSTVEQVCNLFLMSIGKGFLGSKTPPNWSYWWYLVSLNCTGNLNFSSEFWRSRWAVFGRLKFHFRFSSLRSPGMLSAIAQSLNLPCWWSKLGGHAPSVLAVTYFNKVKFTRNFRSCSKNWIEKQDGRFVAMVTKYLQTLNLKFDQVKFNSLVLMWERNFEVTFGIFSVLVFQIIV